jgi:hypothetical protein
MQRDFLLPLRIATPTMLTVVFMGLLYVAHDKAFLGTLLHLSVHAHVGRSV